jgi:hypothetical protein
MLLSRLNAAIIALDAFFMGKSNRLHYFYKLHNFKENSAL